MSDMQNQPQLVQYSPDGCWWWDGAQWQPVPGRTPVARFESPKAAASVLTAVLAFFTLIDLGWIYALVQNMGYASDIQNGTLTASLDEVRNSDNLVAGFALFVLVALFASVVTYVVWAYRSYCNLPALGAKQLARTPKWVILANIIPIVSLYMPYQIMRDTWVASDPQRQSTSLSDREHAKGWWLLGVWWTCWLVGNVLARIGTAIIQPHDAGSLASGRGWMIAGQLVLGIAAVTLILVVRSVTARQVTKVAARATGVAV